MCGYKLLTAIVQPLQLCQQFSRFNPLIGHLEKSRLSIMSNRCVCKKWWKGIT